MIRHMAEEERRDVIIDHPNRRKPASRATKWVVVLLQLVSIALMAFVAIGGWTALEGTRGVLIAYMGLYVLLMIYTLRWNRGALPMSAALAIILLIFAAIAGPEWFARDKTGYTDPAVDSGVLGIATLLIIPVSILLIAFSLRGFQQAWNVEVERRPSAETAAA
jgi:TRAP-type C4-dicarboxylate transport system permease small subunit